MEILMIIATLLAFYIKGLAGFANTLIFTSVLSWETNNINISPMELVLGYPSNIIISWKERKNSDYKIWLPLSIFVIIGSIPGMIFFREYLHCIHYRKYVSYSYVFYNGNN